MNTDNSAGKAWGGGGSRVKGINVGGRRTSVILSPILFTFFKI